MDNFKIPCTRNQCCCNKLIIWVLQFSTVFWDFFAVAPKSVLILKKTNIIGCFLNTVNIPTVLKFMVSVPVPRSHKMIEQIPFSCRSMILLYCLVYISRRNLLSIGMTSNFQLSLSIWSLYCKVRYWCWLIDCFRLSMWPGVILQGVLPYVKFINLMAKFIHI